MSKLEQYLKKNEGCLTEEAVRQYYKNKLGVEALPLKLEITSYRFGGVDDPRVEYYVKVVDDRIVGHIRRFNGSMTFLTKRGAVFTDLENRLLDLVGEKNYFEGKAELPY